MNILITGSNGFVGSALVDQILLRTFFNIIAPVRHLEVGASQNDRVLRLPIDSLFEIKLDHLKPVEVVIHVAGAAHDVSGANLNEEYYSEVNVEATRHLLRQAVSAGCKQFIFLSSIGVHGISSGETPFTETSLIKPYNHYSRSKAEAEKSVIEGLKGTGCTYTVFRPSLIVGKRAPGNLNRLCGLIRKRVPLPLGSVKNKRNVMVLSNFSSVIVQSLGNPRFYNQTFLVADSEVLSTRQMVEHLADGIGVRPIFFPLPVTFLKIAFALLGKKKLYHQLCGNLEVDTTALCAVTDTAGWRLLSDALVEVGDEYNRLKVND